MKFCKLQRRIADFADPAWAPYWTNYKHLKKIIKDLPHNNVSACSSPIDIRLRMEKCPGEIAFFKLLHSEFRKVSMFFEKMFQDLIQQENEVEKELEALIQSKSRLSSSRTVTFDGDAETDTDIETDTDTNTDRNTNMRTDMNMNMDMDMNLNLNLNTDYYRKYSEMAKKIYLLHRDELLLELYAIMSYISFSKILKKHDKNTGYKTSAAFMSNLVNKANFAHYPDLTKMIHRSEEMFDTFLQQIPDDGYGHKILGDDEKLFISMIHRFYGQILDEAGKDVAPDAVPLLRRRSEHGESDHSSTMDES